MADGPSTDPPVPVIGYMRLDRYEFDIQAATFRFITASSSGPGWDFSIYGECMNDDPYVNPEDESDIESFTMFPDGFRILTEAAPLPFAPAADLTGIDFVLPLSYDEPSGEPLFGINIGEEHELSAVHLRFTERRPEDGMYRIDMSATVSPTVLGEEATLRLWTWIRQDPDGAYPV